MHILYFRSENSLKVFEAEKESPPKFHQTSSISSNTQQANKLLYTQIFQRSIKAMVLSSLEGLYIQL